MFLARWVIGLQEAAPCLAIRRAVYGDAAAIPDWFDGIAAHLLVLEIPDDGGEADGVPVATARMYPDGMDTRIGDIAVLSEKRGGRYGDLCTRMLLYKAEQLVPERILARVPCGMQAYYRGFGFAPCGPEEDGFVEMMVEKDSIIWDSMCKH